MKRAKIYPWPGSSHLFPEEKRAVSNSAVKLRREASERRRRPRTAPGYPSRRGAKLIEGLTKSELVQKYTPKVRIIALTIAGKIPAAPSDLEDLISVGFIGLMDAADKYEAARGIKFATYAEFRIRGAILDELRNMDCLPRSMRSLTKKIERISNEIQLRTGRLPTDAEVSGILRIGTEDLREFKRRSTPVHWVNFDELVSASGFGDFLERKMEENTGFSLTSDSDPSLLVMRNDTRQYLDNLIQELADGERLVLTLYYYRGLNLGEIATILNVSESRISQIHSGAILKLRERVRRAVPDARKLFLMLLAA